MVQELTSQPSIFGRLGKGLGQGLAEQVPKEVERYRLSEGLKQFEKDSGNLDPLQSATRLFSIPGISPAMVQALPELLKYKAERNAALNAANQGQPSTSESQGMQQQKSKQIIPEKERDPSSNRREDPIKEANRLIPSQSGLTTYSPVQTALGEIREPTQQELFAKRAEILNQNKWMSIPAADQQAVDFFRRQNAQKLARIEQGSRQEALEQKIEAKRDQLKKSLGTLLDDIPEETFDRAVMRQQYNVANGMTPTQASNAEKKNMMGLAKAYNSLKNNIGNRPLMEVAGTELRKSIRDLKTPFKQNDELPLFKNTLVNNLDIGDHLASYETWNPSKKIERDIINTSVNDDPKEVAARLAKNLDEGQSLFGIGYLLHKIGQDDKAVIDEIMNLSRNGIIKLDQRQIQEGSEYFPVQPKLEDDFFTSFGGLLIGPALKYITGQREKVGTIEKLKRNFGGKQ